MGNKSIKQIKSTGIQPENPNFITIDKKITKNSTNESENFKMIKKHNKDCDDALLIDESLINHFFLRSLEKQARTEIIKEMSLCLVKKGTILFHQGAFGNYFYILKEGGLDLLINGDKIKTIKPGEIIGELALLYECPRMGTIKANTECTLYTMERRNFKKIVEHIIHINFEDNKKFINSQPVLSMIEHEQKNLFCNNLLKLTFDEKYKIIRKGEISTNLYFINSGEVEIRNPKLNNQVIKTLKKGDYFGEKEILINSLRLFDTVCKTKCVIYSISCSALFKIFGENYKNILFLSFIKNSFLKSKNFKKLNVKILDSLFDNFIVKNVQKEDIIYHSGFDMSSKLIITINGDLVADKTKEIISNRGMILFEDDILTNSKKKLPYNLVSSPDILLLEGDIKGILQKFGCSFKEQLDKSGVIDSLKKVNLFKTFTTAKFEDLSQKIKIDKIPNGKNVLTQGEEGTRFFIIKSGKVDIFVGKKYIRTMNENEYLGERALFFKEPRSATGTAQGDVEVFYLEKDDFMQVIENNLKDYLLSRLYLQDNTVQLNDLIFYDVLGSGNYGTVSLVKNKKNNYYYAIKNISNKQILYSQIHENLLLERSILLQIDHPFIVKLVKSLKDQNYVYFLMDYIKGKELFDVIRDIGLLSKFQTQFYGASMMLAVEYLHERKFIFRDIKPENIMVLENGYIKVIDFGTAKAITDRTSTIIGTPHYMAPEVILGDGYSFQVDFWSIGVCMYEFMCGAVPFGETAEEPMDVYLSIINE